MSTKPSLDLTRHLESKTHFNHLYESVVNHARSVRMCRDAKDEVDEALYILLELHRYASAAWEEEKARSPTRRRSPCGA